MVLAQKFRSDESGAVTVDVVVVSAAVVALGVAVLGSVSGGVENQSRDIARFLSGLDRVVTSAAGDWFDDIRGGHSTGGGAGGAIADVTAESGAGTETAAGDSAADSTAGGADQGAATEITSSDSATDNQDDEEAPDNSDLADNGGSGDGNTSSRDDDGSADVDFGGSSDESSAVDGLDGVKHAKVGASYLTGGHPGDIAFEPVRGDGSEVRRVV